MQHLLPFKSEITGIEAPGKFDFPFHYHPHKLAKIAARELQDYLQKQQDWYHDFGFHQKPEDETQGKMFGVLVVEDSRGELAYLCAFSGRLAGKSVLAPFVPPVMDTLVEGDFFRRGEAELNVLNARLNQLETAAEYQHLKERLAGKEAENQQRLQAARQALKEARAERNYKRKQHKREGSESAYQALERELAKESTDQSYAYKRLKRELAAEIEQLKLEVQHFDDLIRDLKLERKKKSRSLQRQIFEQFEFLNACGELRSLYDIFQYATNENPPAAAGECAAPKLLNYAYQQGLKPLCMAEFWWGAPPPKEVRKHRQFYPACRGKCEPILGHMLQGMAVAPNPLQVPHRAPVEIEILYEDEHILALNKPHEFLSVPGKNVEDSVFLRMKERYPEATGPLIVHRLDMSTSGILLVAKTREAHKALQLQFKERSIAKRYVAVLDGILEKDHGLINLPLRVDLNNRPRQLVCEEYGKAAVTKWELIARNAGKTVVYFYPITGRTHQLRVHAAHARGLGTAILGDDLYGTPADRLYLHAQRISFKHPISGKPLTLESPIPW